MAESDNNAARVRNPCTRPFAHFHGFPDASIGFQAALQSLQECRIGDQLQNVLNSEFFSMEKDVIVEAPMERSLLLVRGALGLGNSFVGDLIGSEGLLGGGALAALGPRIDGGPLGFGVAPVAAPRTESEMQGVQQQYMVNYSRGPWNIQTGVQVGVMAQDLVGDTFFLPPSGVPTGIPATPGVQPPPPALQSPQVITCDLYYGVSLTGAILLTLHHWFYTYTARVDSYLVVCRPNNDLLLTSSKLLDQENLSRTSFKFRALPGKSSKRNTDVHGCS